MAKTLRFLMHWLVGLSLLFAVLPNPALPLQNRTVSAEVAANDPPPPVSEREDRATSEPPPAQPPAPPVPSMMIHLKSRTFLPGEPDLLALERLAAAGAERMHFLLQLDFIPRQAAKDAFAASGISLLAYVPDYAWIASAPADRLTTVMAHPGVTWVGPLDVQDKLDPAIVQGQWGAYNLTPQGVAAVYVALHRDESLDTGRALVAQHGGKIVGEVMGINLLVVEMPRANIEALAAADAVQWIEPAAPPLTGTNDGSRAQIGVNTLQAAPYNLNGTNIDVLVYDSGQVGDHVDFGTRLVHGDADTVSDHSTHVAGTLGGSGANSAAQGGTALQWRGMAPAVDLISYGTNYSGSGVIFYEDVPDIENNWAQAQNTYGADLGNASVGSNIYLNYYLTSCNLMGNYGASAVLIDQIVRGGNSVVGIGDRYIAAWAVGNERGWTTSCTGAGGGYGLIAPPAAAKNPIHVGGANTNDNTQYAHTSWGPTDDGRLKPIVTAGGCQTSGDLGIKSTDNNPVNAYTVMCGTSMATPAVSGGIALMLQHYRAVYNTSGNFWPSTAKAILMQTATDLGNTGPDYQYGYGLVNIQAAVDLISRKAFRQDSVAQGAVDVFSLIVPTNATPAAVSLAWDDYEATFNANPTLINNLDLELVAPSGTIWRPWVLNPASPSSNATRAVDSRNNQEQVQVPTPEVGTWLVRVKGTTVPQGPQDYTLVCEGCEVLNLGVCQGEVGGTAMSADGDSTELPTPQGLGEDDTQADMPVAQPSVGELWQRALEAALGDGSRQTDTEPALGALELAKVQGPAAVVALQDTLDAGDLDLVIAEIAEARDRLPQSALPEGIPVSEEEELASLRALEALEEANRALALSDFDDPAENAARGAVQNPPAAVQQNGVTADRTVGNGCTYATIAAAIAASGAGDRLLIEGGRTFNENITIPINLTLQGGYPGCASASSARTTLNGSASGTVVIVNRAITVSLQNLNITNGSTGWEGGGIRFAYGDGTGTLNLSNISIYGNSAQWGGGLWVGPDAQVNGEGVAIYNNTGTEYGGGVRLFGSRATFSNSTIHDNNAPRGGGVYATRDSGYAPAISLPSLTDLYSNQATSGDGLGGGVYLREGTLIMADNSDIYSNNAVQGGGAYLVTSTLTIDGSSSWIYYNAASGDGGGIRAQGSSVNLDNEAQLYDNDAVTGGGAYLDNSDLYIDRGSIRSNTAISHGGGVYATNTSVVDMDLGGYTCLGPRCSQLSYNTSSGNYGGGVFANNSTVDLRNTFIESNAAVYGGGVYVYNGSALYAYNSLFARNAASSNIGDAIRLNSASMTGAGNTLAYNDTGGASTGQAIGLVGSTLSLHCSVIWAHTSSIDAAGQNVTYSDIQGGYAGTGNLNVNPLFVAPGSYDYHLQNTSPVIDRCAQFGGLDVDFDNETRPIVRLTAATPFDMGADEAAGVNRVGINGGVCAYATIQQAVNAASDGDTLQVAEGVYFETVDIPSGRRLTIEGGYNATCTTDIAGTTRVEGSAGVGSTFDIVNNAVVTLRDLQIAWGDGQGGGVEAYSGAKVTLDNADVLNNHGTYGGGIYVATNAVMTTTNGTEIRNNTATSFGGGGRVWGAFSAYSNDSDIHDNCAPHGGGFTVPGGMLHLDAADVYLNDAAATDGKGGGIYVTQGGSVSLRNAAFVYYLNRAYDGAGIYADDATVDLQGTTTTLRDNVAAHYGGGLYLGNGSTLTSNGARIGQAGSLSIANEAVHGAGLYAANSTVEFNGFIQNNLASGTGGGIYATGSTLHLESTTVGGTSTGAANQLTNTGHEGVGLFLTGNTRATLNATVVSSNTFQSTFYTYGGGAMVDAGSVLTMTNSRIERHLAPDTVDGRGAGLYVRNATVTLDNSEILSNTAGAVGGGLRVYGGTLNVLNGSRLVNNRALTGLGGAIAATYDLANPIIAVSNATLSSNTASTHGGAIYMDSGTLDFTGGWTLRQNTAEGGNGGAIALVGTADGRFRAQAYSLVYFNRALNGHGGFVYSNNSTTTELHANSGAQMVVYANHAGGNGGALHGDGGGFFDVYGQVNFDRNRADHGGAIYLSNASTLWLDDWFSTGPQLWDNFADYGSGGAIYALNSPRVELDGVTLGRNGEGNHAAVDGGAVYLSGSALDAENCLFIDNEANNHGGAIAATNSAVTLHALFGPSVNTETGGINARDALAENTSLFPESVFLATACNPSVELCSALLDNVADRNADNTGDGGAIYSNGGTLVLRHTILGTNTAYRGGAIFQTGASASSQVENSLIHNNAVGIALGAGIRSEGGAFAVTHTTLANNIGGAGYSQSTTAGAVNNSIAWGNTDGGFWIASGTLTGVCNLDQSGNAGPATDPRFMSPASQNFHLRGNSPAINACASGLTPDLDAIPRPFGSAYDMGAYEYRPKLIHLPLVLRNSAP